MTDERWTQLFELVGALPSPPALAPAALAQRFGEPRSWRVRAGQVWRARGDDVTCVVYLKEVTDAQLTAVPVTFGSRNTPEGSAFIGESLTVFSSQVTVWLTLARAMNWGALEAPLDQWASPLVDWLNHPEDLQAPASCHYEHAPMPLLVSAWDEMDELNDELEALAHQFPALTAPPGGDSPTDVPLATMQPSDIAKWLAVTVAEAQDMRRGYVDLTEEQMTTLGTKSGQVPVPVSLLPQDALNEARHPRWRPDVERLATGWDVGIADGQRRLAQGAFALAARTTGGETGMWRARIEAFLSSESPGEPG